MDRLRAENKALHDRLERVERKLASNNEPIYADDAPAAEAKGVQDTPARKGKKHPPRLLPDRVR